MVKKSMKRKLSKSNKRMSIWLKKFWWIIAVLCVLFIVIFIWVKQVADSNLIQSKFDQGYVDVFSLSESLKGVFSEKPATGSVTKGCEKIYYGVTAYIRCGISLDYRIGTVNAENIKNTMVQKMLESQFQQVEISPAKDGNGGKITANTKSNLSCTGWWAVDEGHPSLSEITLFCFDYAPRFLDGYEVID